MLGPVISLPPTARQGDSPNEIHAVGDSSPLMTMLLEEFSEPGNLVFDPFAGFGTALLAAERMGRRPLGLEILPRRVEHARAMLADPSAIIEADARHLDELDLPRFDFAFRSPPFMTRTNHRENPLTGYQTLDGDYRRYLEELAKVYSKIKDLAAFGAAAIVNVANVRLDGSTTPLAWDLARALSDVLDFEREIVVDRAAQPSWFTNEYCLVFHC
ncbi:MAG: DNA methyltransferase [Actinopolymorphaceae bacterium]